MLGIKHQLRMCARLFVDAGYAELRKSVVWCADSISEVERSRCMVAELDEGYCLLQRYWHLKMLFLFQRRVEL